MAEAERDGGEGLLLPVARGRGEMAKMGQVCVSPSVLLYVLTFTGISVSQRKQNNRETKTNSEVVSVGVEGLVPRCQGRSS